MKMLNNLYRNGKIIRSDVSGEIKVNAAIPESTEINVFLQAPNPLGDFSIHECLYDT